MGVQNLWTIVEPCGRRINIESLRGKRLAVDASGWLFKFIKVMRNDQGELIPDAHLIGFFRRICRLLYHQIKPVFVFDGSTPALKRQTVRERRKRREQQEIRVRKTAEKFLLNRLKQHALAQLAASNPQQVVPPNNIQQGPAAQNGGSGGGLINDVAADVAGTSNGHNNNNNNPLSAANNNNEPNAPTSQQQQQQQNQVADDIINLAALSSDEEEDDDDFALELLLPDGTTQVDPAVLATLPPSVQLDIITKLRAHQAAITRGELEGKAEAPEEFSQHQLKQYLKTTALKQKLDVLRGSAASSQGGVGAARRIAAEIGREYVLDRIEEEEPQQDGGGEAAGSSRRNEKQQGGARVVEEAAPAPVSAEAMAGGGEKVIKISFEIPVEHHSDDSLEWEDVDDDLGDDNLLNSASQEQQGKHGTSRKDVWSLSHGFKFGRKLASWGEDHPGAPQQQDTLLAESEADRDLQLAIQASLQDVGGTPSANGAGPSNVNMDVDFLVEKTQEYRAALPVAVAKQIPEQQQQQQQESMVIETGTVQHRQQQPQQPQQQQKKTRLIPVPRPVSGATAPPSTTTNKNKPSEKESLENDEDVIDAVAEGNNDGTGSLGTRQQNTSLHEPKALPSTVGVNHLDDDVEMVAPEQGGEDIEECMEIDQGEQEVVIEQVENDVYSEKKNNTNDVGKEEKLAPRPLLLPDNKGLLVVSTSLQQPPAIPSILDQIPTSDVPTTTATETNVVMNAQKQQQRRQQETVVVVNGDVASGSQQQQQQPLFDEAEMFRDLDPTTLQQEEHALRAERRAAMGQTDAPTEEMYQECQELLQLFGIPFIIAPGEAEAQCAWLDDNGLVDGVVTDDNDAFLFGARRVYRNIFEGKRYVEEYRSQDLETELGLTRSVLVRLALLLGSDYTAGVGGVGVVNALEIVRAFPDLDALKRFGHWVENLDEDIMDELAKVNKGGKKGSKGGRKNSKKKTPQKKGGGGKGKKTPPRKKNNDSGGPSPAAQPTNDDDSEEESDEEDENPEEQVVDIETEFKKTHKNIRRSWVLPANFPSQEVVAGYEEAKVDTSTQKFTFGRPDLDALRNLCWTRFAWPKERADELLLPMIKAFDERQAQTTLDSFLSYRQRFAKIKSKRMQKAVAAITKGKGAAQTEIMLDDDQEQQVVKKKAAPKRKQKSSPQQQQQGDDNVIVIDDDDNGDNGVAEGGDDGDWEEPRPAAKRPRQRRARKGK